MSYTLRTFYPASAEFVENKAESSFVSCSRQLEVQHGRASNACSLHALNKADSGMIAESFSRRTSKSQARTGPMCPKTASFVLNRPIGDC